MSYPSFSAGLARSSKILQPHLTRFRNRYKGVKESAKLNLFSHQFYTDINILRPRIEEVTESKDDVEALVYGSKEITSERAAYLAEVLSHWETDEATPDSDVPILDIAQNAPICRADIASIESRLNRLERM